MKVHSTKVNSMKGSWINALVKEAEYNEGDPYDDLFQGVDYDNSLVEFKDKESSSYDEEIYKTNSMR